MLSVVFKDSRPRSTIVDTCLIWYLEPKVFKNVFRLFLENSVKVHCSFSKYYWLSIVCLVLHFMNTNYVQQSIKMLWFHLRWPFSVSLGYYENVIPPQAEFVFRLFLIWEHFEAQRSYEIVLMKSPLISDWRVAHTFRILPHPILDFIISLYHQEEFLAWSFWPILPQTKHYTGYFYCSTVSFHTKNALTSFCLKNHLRYCF